MDVSPYACMPQHARKLAPLLAHTTHLSPTPSGMTSVGWGTPHYIHACMHACVLGGGHVMRHTHMHDEDAAHPSTHMHDGLMTSVRWGTPQHMHA